MVKLLLFTCISLLVQTSIAMAQDAGGTPPKGFYLKRGIYDTLNDRDTCSWKVDFYSDKLAITPVNRYNGYQCNRTDAKYLDGCKSIENGKGISCCGDRIGEKYCMYSFRAYMPDIIDAQGSGPSYDLGLLRWVAESSPTPNMFKKSVSLGWEVSKVSNTLCKFPNNTQIECKSIDADHIRPFCANLEEEAAQNAVNACKGAGYMNCDTLGSSHRIIVKGERSDLTLWSGCIGEAKVKGSPQTSSFLAE